MKTIRGSIRCLIALAALTLWVSFAADIDGKWTGQVEGRNGPQTQTLMLKASGGTLTGSIQGRQGEPVEISNGTIGDGGAVAFTVVREFRGEQNYAGIQGHAFRRRVETDRVRRTRRAARSDLQKGIAAKPVHTAWPHFQETVLQGGLRFRARDRQTRLEQQYRAAAGGSWQGRPPKSYCLDLAASDTKLLHDFHCSGDAQSSASASESGCSR